MLNVLTFCKNQTVRNWLYKYLLDELGKNSENFDLIPADVQFKIYEYIAIRNSIPFIITQNNKWIQRYVWCIYCFNLGGIGLSLPVLEMWGKIAGIYLVSPIFDSASLFIRRLTGFQANFAPVQKIFLIIDNP